MSRETSCHLSFSPGTGLPTSAIRFPYFRDRAFRKSNSRVTVVEKPRFSSAHYASLDGLRGIAFLLVFFHHYGLSSHSRQPMILTLEWLAGGGWAGVDLFFVLSGFLITGILLDTRDGRYYFRNFYARRILRIFPLFYGVLLLLLLATPILHLYWRLGHILYFFYLGNIAGHIDPSLNFVLPAVNLTHTWSLAVEEQFYVVWPLVILLVSDCRTLIKTCCGLIGFGFVLRAGLLLAAPGPSMEWSYGELPTHADGLLCGAILAVLIRTVAVQELVRRSRWIVALAFAGLAGLAVINGGLNYHTRSMTLFVYPLLAVFFSGILLRTLQPGTLFNSVGNRRVLRFFGKYSYGMYIYHQILSPFTFRYLRMSQRLLHSVVLGGLAYVALALVGTTAVSVLSYQMYESKFLKLKSRFPYQGRIQESKAET
jgi:peptidoglycan/LPS O-acetylase OafA/YrhL